MQRFIVGVMVVMVVVGLGIYATETTVRVRELQREDELAQDSMDRIERALIRLDARMFGPIGQVDQTAGSLDGAPEPLPIDEAGRWTAVFVWPKDRQQNQTAARLAWYFRTPELQSLLDQTIVDQHVADAEEPMWRDVYSKLYPGEDVQFWLLKPEPAGAERLARTIYRVAGSELPAGPDELATAIREKIRECCPRPKPAPSPAPVAITVEAIPDVPPPAAPPPGEFPWAMLALASALALLGGYMVARRFNAQ